MSFGEDILLLVQEAQDGALSKAPSWERISLGEVATILNGYPWKSEYFGSSEGTALIRIRDVTTGATETRYSGPIVEGFWIEPGDLLVGMDGDFNLRRWASSRGLLNQRVCKLQTNPEIYGSTFLEYVLPAYLKLINTNTSSVTVKHLSSRTLAEIPLPLPPVAEQRRIVAKLDVLTARLARARAELNRIHFLLTKQRETILAAHITKRTRNVPRVRFDKKISILTSGSRDWAKYYDRGTSVFVLAGNIRTLRFDPTPKQLVDPPLDSADARRSRIKKDDILVTIVGAGTGDICHVSRDLDNYFVCQSVARVGLDDPRLAEFYVHWFASGEHGRADFVRTMYGAARPHLSFEQMNGFLVPNVDVAIAKETVNAIKQDLARTDRLEAETKRARALLDRLEVAIVKKAFRGELVAQDPNDEPASALLKRIRAQRVAAPTPKQHRRAPTSHSL